MSASIEEQQVREHLSKFLDEGESLTAITKGRQGVQSMVILWFLVGVLFRVFGTILHVGRTNKRLLIAVEGGDLLASHDLTELQSLGYNKGLSWISHFYPSWITIQGKDGAKLYVLVYGQWRDYAEDVISST